MRPTSMLLLSPTCLLLLASLVWGSLGSEWEAYKSQHGKEYKNPIEESVRRSIFHKNKRLVEEFNEKHSDEAGYRKGLNHLSDRTEAELERLNGIKMSPLEARTLSSSLESRKFIESILSEPAKIPDELDWRKVPGRVTPVKNQGNCGSCWAFATTGTLEGVQARMNISLTGLSEQNLVDCSNDNNGCSGGIMSLALSFIRDQGGIDDQSSYPYEGSEGVCHFKKDKVVMSDSGAALLTPGDEEELKQIVARVGPVAVAIYASSNFQAYSSGYFDDQYCDEQPNHGVLVVGYGTDPKKGDYWIVKNSWSQAWGESGYIKMPRNKNNRCQIASLPTIPMLV